MSQILFPKGWQNVRLSNKEFFKDIIGGGTPSRERPDYFGGGIPWVRLSDMKSRYISQTKETLTEEGLRNSSARMLPKNSIILSTRATIGEVAIAKTNVCTNQGFKSIICNEEKIIPEFLYYFLKSNKQILQSKSKSTTYAEINKTNLESIEIIIPSLKIQKKIVQKLEFVLSQIEEKRKAIQELQEGKRKNLQSLSHKVIGTIISNLMKLSSPPNSWRIQKLEDVCQNIQPGFAQGEKNVKEGVIHLRMNNISTNFELNFDLLRTVDATKEQLKKYTLEQGDIIFNNTNSSKLVGKSVIFDSSRVCLYSNHLTRLRVKRDIILPHWLLFYLRARWLNGDFERMCNKWINQAAVNQHKIISLEIPVPSLESQKKIVESLSNISATIEKIRGMTESIILKDEMMRKLFGNISSQILNAAFTGKLIN